VPFAACLSNRRRRFPVVKGNRHSSNLHVLWLIEQALGIKAGADEPQA